MANNMPTQYNGLDGLKRDLVAKRSFGCEKRCPKADNTLGLRHWGLGALLQAPSFMRI